MIIMYLSCIMYESSSNEGQASTNWLYLHFFLQSNNICFQQCLNFRKFGTVMLQYCQPEKVYQESLWYY